MSFDLDLSTPTLSALRRAVGDAATVEILRAHGGKAFYLPTAPTAQCEVVLALGMEAARALIDAYGGGRNLILPTGRGLAHGRRIDPRRVEQLSALGYTAEEIACELSCTMRQVHAIRAQLRGSGDPRQGRLI